MQQSKKKFADILRSLPGTGWLSEQPLEFQCRFALSGRWTTLRRGEFLYTFGDIPNAIYGLGEGLLDLSIPIAGDEEVTIYRAGPGFWIGDSALLAETTRSMSVVAVRECRVFRVPVDAVLRQLATHPEDWPCFFRLSHMNASLALRIHAEVLSLPPKIRFARMLLRLASSDGSVRATQEELGRMAGMSRAAFRRAFTMLIAVGAVRTEYGSIWIVDRAAIQRVARPD